jgi:acyl dehydratase
MENSAARKRGLYFEEFTPGMTITSAGRTVTESDIVSFACLTGDFNQIHVDAEYARDTPFGQRVAHGLLVLSFSLGLAVQTGVLEGTILAFREVIEWKFSKPVFIGDTIQVSMTVTEVKEIKRINAGSVTVNVEVKNQRSEVVNKGILSFLMALQPG